MIGIYDYTVVLTYAGLLCALGGIFRATEGAFYSALFLIGITLFCDMMDGRVARAKKNRTRQEVLFGMQIDSLCDLVSFGVFPSVLFYNMGMKDALGLVVIGYYCLCCVIRLGYFNVLELERDPDTKSVFHGLPSPTLAMCLPVVYLLRLWVSEPAFLWILRILMPTMGTLYILNFKLSKPKGWMLLVMSGVFAALLVAIYLCS